MRLIFWALSAPTLCCGHVDLGVGDTASLRKLLSGEPYFSKVAAHEGIVSLGLRERHSGSLAPGRLSH